MFPVHLSENDAKVDIVSDSWHTQQTACAWTDSVWNIQVFPTIKAVIFILMFQLSSPTSYHARPRQLIQHINVSDKSNNVSSHFSLITENIIECIHP
jgi:hypothetical protein